VDGSSSSMTFTYLGIDIISDRNITTESNRQAMKATKVSGCLRETVWTNKHMTTECKMRVKQLCDRLFYPTRQKLELRKREQNR